MKKIDVLLINLPINSWYKDKMASRSSMPPLGLLYIASYLEKNNYKVKVIDLSVEEMSLEEFKSFLLILSPKVIGMSTYNESWISQKSLCRIIKKLLPNTIISAGGAFATFCHEDVLNQSLTDYVIKGEGEHSFLKLCEYIINNKKYNLSIDIPGLCYKDKDGKIVTNLEIDRIINLDDLPYPARDLVKLDKYTMPYSISTSRGCPGECIFCSSKAFWGKKVIVRSVESVFDEIMELNHKYGSNFFSITDDTFTISKKRCLEFCDMLNKSGVSFIWECESRADVIDEELIRALYKSGCHKIQFGLESADNNILMKLKKNVTVEQIENAVKYAWKYGMHIQVSYIIGHAYDTEDTIRMTMNFAKHLKNSYGARVVCSVNTPFPGTEQYYKSEELGIDIKTSQWEKFILSNPIISTKNLTINELRYYLNEGLKLID